MNILENGFSGSTIKHISKEYIKDIEIPIPSISVQKKIVEQLDILSQNIQTSKQQIEESKKILKYYVETMTLWDESKKMSDILDYVKTGKNKPSDNKNGTKYPYFATNGINGYTDEYIFDGLLLLTPRNGTIGKIFKSNEKIFPSDHMFVLKFKQEQHIKYYYHYLTSCNDFDSKKHGSTIPNITKSDIEDFQIKLPSLDKQKQIVSYCDDIEETIKSMEKRIKNNEDLMKLTIETYLKNNKEESESDSESDNSSSSESESEDEKPVKKSTTKKKVETTSESESEEEQSKKKVSKPIAKSPTKKLSFKK